MTAARRPTPPPTVTVQEPGWANSQAEATQFIYDYLTAHGGQAPAGQVTDAAVTAGLDAAAVKHARARAANPAIASERGSRGWMWRIQGAQGA